MYEGVFLILARMVQFIFIGGVGVGLALSYLKSKSGLNAKPSRQFLSKHAVRALALLGIAYGVTLVTYVFVGERFVQFGILHLLAVNIFLFRYLAHRPLCALLVSVLIIIFTPLLKETVTTTTPLYYLWYAMGLAHQGKGVAIDYFPLLPWSAVTGIGITVGHLVYNSQFTKIIQNFTNPIRAGVASLFSKFISPLLFLGRHSLIIYLIHVPLIVFLLLLTGVLDWSIYL